LSHRRDDAIAVDLPYCADADVLAVEAALRSRMVPLLLAMGRAIEAIAPVSHRRTKRRNSMSDGQPGSVRFS